MKFLLAAVLILCAVAAAAHVRLQVHQNGGAARLVNVGDHFVVCEILVYGRVAYWELYPGQATSWYRGIEDWKCTE